MSQMPALVGAAVSFWEDIDEQVLGAPAAPITFSGIDTAFTFLRVTAWTRQTAAGGVHTLKLNNDGAANYEHQLVKANGGLVTAARTLATTQFLLSDGVIANGDEGQHTVIIAKPLAAEEGQVVHLDGNGPGATILLNLYGGQWNNNAALISRIDLGTSGGNFATGTRVLLEGGKPA